MWNVPLVDAPNDWAQSLIAGKELLFVNNLCGGRPSDCRYWRIFFRKRPGGCRRLALRGGSRQSAMIEDCGHYQAAEQPERLARL